MGSPLDDHEHQLLLAQLTAERIAVERLIRARARLARFSPPLADIDSPRIAISPWQLRLVVGE